MTSAVHRWLIVNADDFGQSAAINRGVIRAHEQGIVTSASLMVRWPAAADAAAYARAREALSLGLHVDLGEWFCAAGQWMPRYEVVATSDEAAVAKEIARQVDVFRELVGRNPTHLDSHQHVHRDEPVRSVMAQLARTLGVPLRECHPDIRYCGGFYGQTDEGAPIPGVISVDGLAGILSDLAPGITELGCHPGEDEPLGDPGMYRSERLHEVTVLCDPRAKTLLTTLDIQLRSFQDVYPHISQAAQHDAASA